jgi:hypothetical protein
LGGWPFNLLLGGETQTITIDAASAITFFISEPLNLSWFKLEVDWHLHSPIFQGNSSSRPY